MRKRDFFEDNEDAGIDMTPMLDIVFIMLIFFIVTTSFVKESGIDINRPIAQTSQKKDKGNNILVAITSNEEIWIDKRQIDLRALRANIQRLTNGDDKTSIIIQADMESKTGLLVAVMDQIKMAGIQSISIATKKE
ncbi:biopolymer transporter ExbD [Sulfurimonas sp.]|uniref:ExbD/TolR family protein n=1 Tax=Sulfurimonas sp. TaxID=2022749 RepID=UPI002B46D60D|nr:biopolymer transporter ExbD [Sulfurimonas sp.]